MSSNLNKYRRRKRKNQVNQAITFTIGLLLAILLTIFLLRTARNLLQPEEQPPETELVMEETEERAALKETQTEVTEEETEKARETEPETEQESDAQSGKPDVYDPANPVETKIYSYLQGPKAWSYKIDWSGAWCHKMIGGQEFGAFGCGLCALANIYSSLTEYECSPLEMYYYAESTTRYTAEDGIGAIDWPELKQVLKSVGITASLKHKNKTYEKFQENIAGAQTAIVLVCSDNDDTYWQNVSGHYVNIWAYDSSDDTVFLADPGNYKHNRRRIPLRYVYDALKTSGSYQYLLVSETDPDTDTWQHEEAGGRWKRPKYCSSQVSAE